VLFSPGWLLSPNRNVYCCYQSSNDKDGVLKLLAYKVTGKVKFLDKSMQKKVYSTKTAASCGCPGRFIAKLFPYNMLLLLNDELTLETSEIF
jgi:hypothetical protein